MSNGKKVTAPCGHDGETVVGAYVRCLQGCAKDPFVQPQVTARKRGEPNHVDYCACKPCTIRRRAKEVVLRTKGGKETRVAWDGIAGVVRWTAEHKDKVRHWKIVDDDGLVLLDGMCDVEMAVGDPMRLEIDSLIPAKLSVVREWKTVLREAVKYGDRNSARLIPYDESKEILLPPLSETRLDIVDVHTIVSKVAGVVKAMVYRTSGGAINVEITEMSATDEQGEKTVLSAVKSQLKETYPRNSILVLRATPMQKITDASAFLHYQLSFQSVDTIDTKKALDRIHESLHARLPGFLSVRLEPDSGGLALEVDYRSSEGTTYRVRHRFVGFGYP